MNRVKRIKNENYTTISNEFLRDENLSLKAKGLLATILSLPEDWDFSIKGICAIIKEGTTAVYSAIDELKSIGYCHVETLRDEKGRVAGSDYTFYENPYVENPNVDNQSQISIEENNISLSIDIAKTNKKDRKKKENKKESDELFEECWIAYKRKGSKKLAFEQWKKLTDKEKQSIMPHIRAYEQSRDLPYRKDFERYLKDKFFLDVVFSKKGAILYDPSMFDVGVYSPRGHGIYYNETKKYYGFMDMYFDGDTIFDDYTDENRPDGATLVLNNARGIIKWNANTKKWEKQ